MRPSAAPAAAALSLTLLLLTGCGGESASGDPSGGDSEAPAGEPVALEDLEPCGALDAETVTRLVGEPVVLADSDAELPTCTFETEGEQGGSLLQVLALPMGGPAGFVDFEQVVDSQRTLAGTEQVEEIDLPGADRAALVDDDGYGLASTTLVATAEGVAYTVYGSGVTRDDQVRIATGALTVLLGGELPAGSLVEAPTDGLCSLLDARALTDALGSSVSAEASELGTGEVCSYTGAEGSLTLVDLGSMSRIESLAESGADEGDAQVDAVDVGPGAVAYLSQDEFGQRGFLARDNRLYSVDVIGAEDARGEQTIREALVLLGEGR